MRTVLLGLALAACAPMTPEQQAQFNRGVDTIIRARQPQALAPIAPQGFYKGDVVSGFNRICYYDRVGSTEAVTIHATQLCPLNLP